MSRIIVVKNPEQLSRCGKGEIYYIAKTAVTKYILINHLASFATHMKTSHIVPNNGFYIKGVGGP